MMKTPHILVIGAGLIGLSSADALQARGASVTIIDAKDGPGLGASFSNSGMIHPSQAAPWLKGDFSEAAQSVISLARRSQELLMKRQAALNLEGVKRPPGCLQLFASKESVRQAAKRYEDMGIIYEEASGQKHSFGRSALFFPGDRSANAYVYCRALEADLKMKGVEILYGASDFLSMNRPFDHVLIAAGTGSCAVARKYGVDLPIKPVGGHALNFARPAAIALPETPIMDFESHSALTVFEDHVRLSGSVDQNDPECLLDIWTDIAPDLMPALGPVLSRWTESRPVSELGRPFIAQLKPGLWVNSGHGHMGWTLSAGSGELIAQMILSGHKDNRFDLP